MATLIPGATTAAPGITGIGNPGVLSACIWKGGADDHRARKPADARGIYGARDLPARKPLYRLFASLHGFVLEATVFSHGARAYACAILLDVWMASTFRVRPGRRIHDAGRRCQVGEASLRRMDRAASKTRLAMSTTLFPELPEGWSVSSLGPDSDYFLS
jgi:hypothetical protein